MSRFARKKDTKHPEIVRHLRTHGLKVEDLGAIGTVPDLLVGKEGQMAFIEVKSVYSKDHRQAAYTRKQLQWISESHGMNVLVATTAEEALKKFRQKEFISDKAKEGLAVMLHFAVSDTFTPSEIEPILAR